MALTNATYRYLAVEIGRGDDLKLKEVYSMAINCHVVLAILIFVCLEIGGVWFLNNHLNIPEGRMEAANWVFQFSLFSFCVGVIQTPYNSNIIAHEKMNFYAVISVLEVILKLIIVYLLIELPFDKLISYSIFQLLIAVIVFACYIIYCRRTLRCGMLG